MSTLRCKLGLHTWSERNCEFCDVCKTTRRGRHRWDGCKCSKCGKAADWEQHGHLWDGCKCSVCGTQRNQDHRWDGCRCAVCNRWHDQDHRWDGCKCTQCSKQRDESHRWDGCKCLRCERERHEWISWREGSVCKTCNEKRFPSYEQYLLNKYSDLMPKRPRSRDGFIFGEAPDVTEFLLNAGETQRQRLREEYSRANDLFIAS